MVPENAEVSFLCSHQLGSTVRKQQEGGCKRIAHLVLPRRQACSHLSHQELDWAPVSGRGVRQEGLVAHHQREQLVGVLCTLQQAEAALESASWGWNPTGHQGLMAAAVWLQVFRHMLQVATALAEAMKAANSPSPSFWP